MRRLLVALLLAGVGLLPGLGMANGGTPAAAPRHRLVLPALSNDAAHTPTRSFAMGFGVVPPRPTVAAVTALLERMAPVAEYALIQREVPWTRLRAGETMDHVVDDEYVAVADAIRGRGMDLVLLVDPLDGLNRTAEAVEATSNGLSLRDPAVRATHAAWVRTLVERLHPRYLGLASEINTLGAHGDRALYEDIRAMINSLAPEVRRISPETRVFVSFQVDDAWGVSPWPASAVDQFAMAREFDVDVVGLSSYPGFSFASPEAIPYGYFRPFVEATGKPVLLAEGGWSSGPGGGSPEQQAAYLAALFDELEAVQAELVLPLLFADLDLADPGWGLPPDRAATLAYFAHMGIVDASLTAKPAFAVWAARFAREQR